MLMFIKQFNGIYDDEDQNGLLDPKGEGWPKAPGSPPIGGMPICIPPPCIGGIGGIPPIGGIPTGGIPPTEP